MVRFVDNRVDSNERLRHLNGSSTSHINGRSASRLEDNLQRVAQAIGSFGSMVQPVPSDSWPSRPQTLSRQPFMGRGSESSAVVPHQPTAGLWSSQDRQAIRISASMDRLSTSLDRFSSVLETCCKAIAAIPLTMKTNSDESIIFNPRPSTIDLTEDIESLGGWGRRRAARQTMSRRSFDVGDDVSSARCCDMTGPDSAPRRRSSSASTVDYTEVEPLMERQDWPSCSRQNARLNEDHGSGGTAKKGRRAKAMPNHGRTRSGSREDSPLIDLTYDPLAASGRFRRKRRSEMSQSLLKTRTLAQARGKSTVTETDISYVCAECGRMEGCNCDQN